MDDLLRLVILLASEFLSPIIKEVFDSMVSLLALFVSILALGATIFQLHLLKQHNHKSLRPLGQIDLVDHKGTLAVYVRNKGMGPMTIYKLIFHKDGREYGNIEDCVELDRKTYMHISISDSIRKTILPNTHFEIFEKKFYKEDGNLDDEMVKHEVRMILATLQLEVHYADIYDNGFTLNRNLDWFARDIELVEENTPAVTTA